MTENKNNVVTYPVIISEHSDSDYHDGRPYYIVESPNIPGMLTDGDTFDEAAFWAIDALATMLEGEEYPEVQDPRKWELKPNESIVYITVDMDAWSKNPRKYMKEQKKKTIRITATVPEYLRDLAKERGINISRVLTEALEQKLGVNR
ncbi:MAG: type II toxin-antitoxin system HicB family antitoxin [Lactobacillaceae bacterium]|jgi:predicted RNase H-like HicB family nuclease|nr:type II toxin-antitoxin system HicB family antitoxin [Lactobacillaceae bacterium]